MPSPAATSVTRPRLRHTRGGTLLPRVDGRLLAARRYRTLVETFEAELGAGPLSAVDREMVRQAAAIALRAEELQTAIVAGHDVDTDDVVRLSSECRRILAGLKAKADKSKPTGPTFQEFVSSLAAEGTDAPEATGA